MKSLETISTEITALEAERDFGDISPEGLEQLAVLNLCYDLLARTRAALSETVAQPDEMKEPGFEDDFIPKYGISWSAIADFAFAVTTKQGSVDMRKVLFDIMRPRTAKSIAENINIRPATLSEYFNKKSGFKADTWEQVANFCINSKY